MAHWLRLIVRRWFRPQFVGGGDWYRSTGLRDASEVCHAARGSHRFPEGDLANDVQQLLDGCGISDPAGIRDYAILMLVARLGLRSIEAARLLLDDLNWRAGRSDLRGKASREDGMPLPTNVVEGLSAYLRRLARRPASRQA